MAKRKTHEEVVTEIGSIAPDIEVIGTYINGRTKLKIKYNSCNHEHYIVPKAFLSGRTRSTCSICTGNKNTKTHETFVSEVAAINPDLVILDTYTGGRVKLRVKLKPKPGNCTHEWLIEPTRLLYSEHTGITCPTCCPNTRKKTHETFVSEVAAINPDIEVLGTYINGRTKLSIRSVVCGHEWVVLPRDFLHQHCGSKCPTCTPITKSQEKFTAEVSAVNSDLEVLGTYKNAHTTLTIKSKVCKHEWEIRPSNFLSGRIGSKCPICLPAGTKPHEVFVQEVESLYPALEVLGKYKGAKCRLQVKSGECGHTWYIEPNGFLSRGANSTCPTCNPKGSSKGERELATWISHYVRIEENTRILDGKEIDIFIPERNLGLEYNGEYWHSDQLKGKNYHIDKTILAKKKGITLIHIFEHEWLNKQEIVKSRILSILGKTYSIGARNCVIKEIPFPKDFLNENHIQGAGSVSKHNIGLYYLDMLVAVMTLSKPRFNSNYEYELIRYCSLTGVTVVGGASRLLRYFIKQHNPLNIISYSDKRWSIGNLYLQLGFVYSHTSDPNYFYFRNGDIVTRYKAQKHKLKDLVPEHYNPEQTETEIMTNAGYLKVYDCGIDVWAYG